MLKKIIIVFGIIVVLIIGTLVAIPMFYSVDELRPQIQAAIEKNIRGKVALGKISLSLFPVINIKIDGVTVSAPAPFDKEPLAKIAAIEVRMPLSSILVSPSGTIVISDTALKMHSEGLKDNLTETLPPPPSVDDLKAAQTEAKKAPALEETLKSLPPFIAKLVSSARFAFELKNTSVVMTQAKAPQGDKTEIRKLNAYLEGIGIDTDMSLRADAELDVVASGATLAGPIETKGTLRFKPVGRDQQITLKIDNDLKALDIAFKPLFRKIAGVPFSAGAEGVALIGVETNKVDLSQLTLRFANVSVVGSLSATTDAIDPTKGEFKANFVVDNFDLAAWGSLIPMVRDFKLGGKVGMNIKASGPLLDPAINLSVKLSDVTGATPELQKPISDLNGTIKVEGTAKYPKVSIDPFSMKLGSGDMALKVETEGLEKIKARIELTSNSLNVDELLGVAPPAAVAAPAKSLTKEEKAAAAAQAKAAAAIPLDAQLDEMAPMVEEQLKNPMLGQMTASMSLSFKKVIVTGAELSNATFNVSFANRKVSIAKTGLNAFGGKVMFDMNLDLNDSKAMAYAMNAGLSGVDVSEMTRIYAPTFKDDISGALTGSFSMSGRGLRKAQLAQNLNGSLNGAFTNGKLSLPIQKLAADSLAEVIKEYTKTGFLSKLGSKVDASAVPEGPRSGGKFHTAKLECTIKGRQINISTLDIVFEADRNKASSFKGTGEASFDRTISFVGTSYLSDEAGRFSYLKGPSGMLEIPLKISGTMDEPKPDYGYTIGILGKRAGKAVAKQQGEAAATKAIDQLAEKGPAPVKDLINKAGGADQVKDKLKKLFR